MRLTAAITREGKWYVARSLEVEVTSQGETVEEALELYFENEEVPSEINTGEQKSW